MRQYLTESIDDYLRFRRSQDYSKNTLRQDSQCLKALLASAGNVGMWQITDKHVERHFEKLSATRTASSLSNDHKVLKKFFEWARKTGRMKPDQDPMYGRRKPKSVQRERDRVHVSLFPALLDAAGEKEPRDRALVAVLLYTLMRDSEVSDLRIKDVDLNAGYLTARIFKTGLEDRIPICEELDEELRKWLTVYSAQVKLEPMHSLIPPRYNSPIIGPNRRYIGHQSLYNPNRRLSQTGRLVKPALEAIGFPVVDEHGKASGEGSHTIRRSGARALFDQLVSHGYDNAGRIVQSLLHHKSMSQTEAYIGITADRLSRDRLIKGQRMYGTDMSNVVSLNRDVAQNT